MCSPLGEGRYSSSLLFSVLLFFFFNFSQVEKLLIWIVRFKAPRSYLLLNCSQYALPGSMHMLVFSLFCPCFRSSNGMSPTYSSVWTGVNFLCPQGDSYMTKICSPDLFFLLYTLRKGHCSFSLSSIWLTRTWLYLEIWVWKFRREAKVARAFYNGVLGTGPTNRKWVLCFVWLHDLLYTSFRPHKEKGDIDQIFPPSKSWRYIHRTEATM